MNMEDPYYKNALIQKYYNYNGISRNLTEEEQVWIKDKKIIKVGYFDDEITAAIAYNKAADSIEEAVRRRKSEFAKSL